MRKILYSVVFIIIVFFFFSERSYCQYIQKFALVVGISDYQHYPPELQLKYADDDAMLFANFLISKEGGSFLSENLIVLTNQNATRSKIIEKIDLLKNKVNYYSLVYIYFAGHGKVDENGFAYLMPYDADPAMPSDKGIRMDLFLEEIKNKVSVQHLICFIDACHSGSAMNQGHSERGEKEEKSRTEKIEQDYISIYNQMWIQLFQNLKETRFSICSASSHENSYEDKNLGGGHGLFTYYLVEGLRGEADGFGNPEKFDGIVTAGELYLYLLENVSRYAANTLSKEQHPIPSPNFTANYPMSIVKSLDYSNKDQIDFSRLTVRIPSYPDEIKELAKKVERNIALILKAMNRGTTNSIAIQSVCTSEGYKQLQRVVLNTYPNPDRLYYAARLLETSDSNCYQVRDITVVITKGTNARLLPLCFRIDNPTGKISGIYFSFPPKIVSKYQSEFQSLKNDTSSLIEQDIMQFLERYNTAYYLEDIDFINAVFSEEALIIIGKVMRTARPNAGIEERVKYYIKTKPEYIESLERVFEYDSLIKLEYSEIMIEKHHLKHFYGVTLRQLWFAENYYDEGYLFLLFEHQGPDKYTIHVRSWQDYKLDQGPLVGNHSVKFWEKH